MKRKDFSVILTRNMLRAPHNSPAAPLKTLDFLNDSVVQPCVHTHFTSLQKCGTACASTDAVPSCDVPVKDRLACLEVNADCGYIQKKKVECT
jgi:hypothetical protein